MSRDLVILPTVALRRQGEDSFEISTKFADGLTSFAERWPGRIKAYCAERAGPDCNLDNKIYHKSDLPFEIQLVDYRRMDVKTAIKPGSVLMGAFDPRHVPILLASQRHGALSVAVAEYSLKARIDAMRESQRNPILLTRRIWWARTFERRSRQLVRRISGVQCNGVPTYSAYRDLSQSPLLFFDNRIAQQMIASQEQLNERMADLLGGGPLRLAFSGQLADHKGVRYLPIVAHHLAKHQIDFTFDVYGNGPKKLELENEIRRYGLQDRMKLQGVLPFREELVPRVRSTVDLFVCCHIQGDPSCTYMETLGCGVPIVGFDNEAWAGMAGRFSAGWTTRLGDPAELARKIIALDQDRQTIRSAAFKAREAAIANSFEKVMDMRIQHLLHLESVGSRKR